MISINVPIKLISPNKKMHHMTYHSKSKKNNEIIRFMLNTHRSKVPSLPVNVRMIRYSKRQFDDDNYRTACKGIKDTIADFLIPGKAPGQADSSPLIQWDYQQQKGNQETLKIEIY
jgi:hypothetical protein